MSRIRVTRILLADGEVMTVEAGDGRCWSSEEVGETEISTREPINLLEPVRCDICGEPITSADS